MGLLENAKTDLKTYTDIEAAGGALRCKALYCMEGERASKYFCNMEKILAPLETSLRSLLKERKSKIKKQRELETYRYWRNI